MLGRLLNAVASLFKLKLAAFELAVVGAGCVIATLSGMAVAGAGARGASASVDRAQLLGRHDVGLAPYGAYAHARGPAGGRYPGEHLGGALQARGGIARLRAAARHALGPDIPSFRTRTSRTYAVGGGAYMARVFPEPVNYLADGRWRPIDDALVPTAGGVRNRANSYSVVLPDRLGQAPERVSSGGASVSLSLQGADARGVVSGNKDTFGNALRGVTADYVSEATVVKEALTLSGPSATSSFRYTLGLSQGLRPSADSGWEYRDSRRGRSAAVLAVGAVHVRGHNCPR